MLIISRRNQVGMWAPGQGGSSTPVRPWDQAFCQYIADATGRRVSAGPVEATAVGNAMIQLKALVAFPDEGAQRELLRRSFRIQCYEPKETKVWDRMYAKYREIVKR